MGELLGNTEVVATFDFQPIHTYVLSCRLTSLICKYYISKPKIWAYTSQQQFLLLIGSQKFKIVFTLTNRYELFCDLDFTYTFWSITILTVTEEDFHGMHIFPLRGDGQIMSEIFYAKKFFRCSLLSPFPICYRVSPEKPFPEINSTRHHSFPLFKFTKKDLRLQN